MGLGKTMVILATIVGSLHRAAAFASKSPSAQESTSNRIKSKATLVVVPSSSKKTTNTNMQRSSLVDLTNTAPSPTRY